MEELSIITRQEAGIASIDNFEELKRTLEAELSVYKTIVYTPDNVKAAKSDKASLNKLKKAIEDRRKEIKRVIMGPYAAVEAQAKELVEMINEPLTLIDEFISQEETREKAERRAEIKAFFDGSASHLGDLAKSLWESPAFFEKKWEAKTTTSNKWKDAVLTKIADATRDLSAIRAAGGKHTAALIDRYLGTLSTDGLSEYRATLDRAFDAVDTAEDTEPDEDDLVTGYKILKLSGTKRQLLQIMDQLEIMGIEVDEIEDGLPQDMKELTEPDFDSFVAFDIETTGTLGAASGDAPPEITEIGAVKVVNGEITERFSRLANPGRKIVPRIARLTHITDEMVQNEPPIGEVIRDFKAFAGNSVLVGHNIKSCDIPHIARAAKKAGIAFENGYFDTYRYAKRMKEAQGWESVKLEYLSEVFGVSQPEAHRAWCDAEANVGVFFKLKELNG